MPREGMQRPGGQANAVVIGASAGGITAIQVILEKLDGSPVCPFIFCLHLHPSQGESLYLDHFFSKHAGFPVSEADSMVKPKSGQGYIAPPNYHLVVERDQTFSLTVEERINYSRPCIDLLFETAADTWRKSLIGILLTGANSDGAAGLLRIRQYGGTAIAQDPDEAESAEMPKSAIEMDAASNVMRLEEISAYLNRTVMRDTKRKEGTPVDATLG